MRASGWFWSALLWAVVFLQASLAADAVADEDRPAVASSAPAPAPPPAAVEAAPPPEMAGPAKRPTEEAAPPPDFVSSQNIENKLDEARQPRKSLFDFGVRDAALRVEDRLYRATRIRLAGLYTALFQHASTGNGPRDAGGGDLDVIATWDAVQRGGKTIGALDVAFEGRHKAWTSIPPSSLSATIDSLWSTTSGFNIQQFSPIQVYWRQSLMQGRLRFRLGKLSPYSTFFGNRINSSSLFFVNYAFADNPAVFMPGNGTGLHVSYDLSPSWTVHGGIQDANGVKTRIDPSSLRLREFWYALQVDYRAKIRGLGEGTYRLGGWYVDARPEVNAEEGAGTVLSIDQELGKRVIAFLRYEYQGQGLINPEVQFSLLTATRSSARGGIGLPGPFARLPDDYMGVAVAWGDPADLAIKDTWVGEIFYRSQIESSSQLTLSLQTIRSSTFFNEVLVFSARFRIEF